ncbi:MAG: IclR family transcriptional regulator C-terminal domain-containing protein [Propionibacteriaceae bacterium]|nr:IclR family transcriptional regulator C-terminal domain-containing protein [Propionibacteriaceae bacterium]
MAPRLFDNTRRLLDLIAEEGPLPTTRLATALGMPRSTVIRLVEALVDIHLLTTLPDGTTDLSARWLALADAACAAREEWTQARSALQQLAEETGCTTTLCVYCDGAVMCLDWIRGRANEVLQVKPGRSLPPHAGAEGRSILSALPADELEHVMAGAPFDSLTPRTMITAEELAGDIARSRRQGYTLSFDDAWPGIGALAAPIKDPICGQLGTIAVSSTSDELLVRATSWSQALLSVVATLDRPDSLT